MNAIADQLGTESLIIQLLVEKQILDAKKLEILRQAQARDHRPPLRIVLEKQLAGDQEVAQTISEYFYIPQLEPKTEGVADDRSLKGLLPERFCRELLLVPVAARGDSIDVAIATPDGLAVLDEIQLITGRTVQPLIASWSTVRQTIEQLYGGMKLNSEVFGESEKAEEQEPGSAEADDVGNQVLKLDAPCPAGNDGRIIRMVNQILEQALRLEASDIHLEPFEDDCRVRLRIDGLLNELPPYSRAHFVPIISRFKILAKMDIAEKRVPQDGAIAVKAGDKRVDLRVNTVPTVYGEKMVIRILDKGAIPLQLTQLGFDEKQSNDLIESIRLPHGLMLVTGPTGSGKSTTLYACLNLLNEPDTNICTVEDPVEYKFKGMNQVNVKGQVGLTFASALRAFLRQDPDVIMVGEVRDQETAQICLRAALTGHFVLSTIHTNDSLASICRLADMGIEPFLLASTLRVVEAQRLIRRLCNECKRPVDRDGESARLLGLQADQVIYGPKGCDDCRGTGYRGRLGVFEVVRITPRMSSLIQSRVPLPQLRKAARELGMKLLFDSALDKVRAGMTSMEEAMSVAISEEE